VAEKYGRNFMRTNLNNHKHSQSRNKADLMTFRKNKKRINVGELEPEAILNAEFDAQRLNSGHLSRQGASLKIKMSFLFLCWGII
jgi:hypothetical protein